MRIENEMLSRFKTQEIESFTSQSEFLSNELDFFFDNVLETVVDYFSEKDLIKV